MGSPISNNIRQGLKKSGFTVVELMVTITIVVLVTGVVLVQYSSFNSSVLLTSQAYKTAFDLREAQSLAISSRGRGTNNTFREEYGLYFNTGAKSQYILFQDVGDIDRPARFNAGEQIGAPTIIDPRFEISGICVSASAVSVCDGNTTDVSNLAVSFERPDFDAAFYAPGLGVPASIQTALIYITSISDDTASKIVRISTSGQISVANLP